MMKHRLLSIFFAVALFSLSAGYPVAAQQSDEASMRQMVQSIQDGWNRKDGKAFAAPFAEEHDYINIYGLYLPKATREGNARAHQQLFDGVYKEVDLQLRVSKIRFLSPGIAVVHIQGHTHLKGKVEEKRQEIVITGVMQKGAEKWEIVAFQNTPVQLRQEKPSSY
jgi:uncharacterized protein (TIGR02246 family)